MTRFKSLLWPWGYFVVYICIVFPTSAQSSLSLHDSLQAAIEKQSNLLINSNIDQVQESGSSTWLDGSPSVSFVHLESGDELGTNESEITFSFDIKSPFLRDVEKKLDSKVDTLQSTAKQQFALILSGRLRSILWELSIQKASFEALNRKQTLLSSLTTQFEEMAAAQAIPQYLALIVQAEMNQLSISFMEYQRNISSLQEQYFALTGLRVLPNQISESLEGEEIAEIANHPDVRALDAEFENAYEMLLGSSKRTTPWSIQLTGKHVSTPGFSENQLGVGVEVPIGIGETLSSLQKSEYAKLTIDHEIARKKLYLQLTENKASRVREYTFLQEKQRLLDKGLSTLHALNKAMGELREANAPNQEFFIRTLLNNIDAQSNVELNRLYTQRQVALIKQAAGITL